MNLDPRDNDDLSYFYFFWSAVSQGSIINIIKLLPEQDGDVKVASKDSSLPTHQAAQNGHTNLVSLLLGHGSKP